MNPSAPPRTGEASAPRSKSVSTETIVLFTVGIAYGLLATSHPALVAVLKDTTSGGVIEPLAIARSLVNTGHFANPFGTPTGPSAITGPVFPVLVAAALLLKSATAQAIFLRAAAAIFHGLELALLPLVSEDVFGKAEVGFIGGLLSIAIPCYRIQPLWDTSLAGLAVVGFCLAAARIDGRSPASMVALGLFFGLVLLLNPALGLPAAIWAFFAARKNGWAPRAAALAVTSAVLVCLPWTIRNYIVLGGLVPIRDNFGVELQISNNDLAASSTLENGASFERFHPSMNAIQASEVRRLGELAYSREKMAAATAWLQQNPRRFTELTIRRIGDYWLVREGVRLIEVGSWIVTLLSLPGIILAIKRGASWGPALLWIFVLAPLPYYIVQSNARYRASLLWVTLLFAGYAFHSAMERLSNARTGLE